MLGAFGGERERVLAVLNELTALSDQLGSATVRDQIQRDVIDKLTSDLFRLVVVGEFNHGKTTLINALIGEEALSVGVTPTTAVVHEIQYGQTPSARVVYESGEEADVAFDQVKLFSIGNPAPTPDPGPVRVLKVNYPAPFLNHNVCVVDTPGVNDLSLTRADITYKYIPQSDAVLFLLDAGQLVKESERAFLQDKLLGQSRDKIVFVVTKKDILEPNEVPRAMAYVQEKLEKLLPSPQVFAVCAQQALRGQRKGSGIDELLAYLSQFLQENRGAIMLDNALEDGLKSCTLIARAIDTKRRALEMSADEIARRIEVIEQDLHGQQRTIDERRAMIREHVAAIKAWVRRDIDGFVSDISEQIPAMVDDASVEDLKSHLGVFLEKTFAQWAEKEAQEVGEELEKLSEKLIVLASEDAREAGRRLSEMLGKEFEPVRIDVDTFGYGVGVVALLGMGLRFVFSNMMLGSVMLLAAPLLAIYARGKAEAQAREKAKQMVPEAVRKAAETAAVKFEQLIDDYAKALDEWVQTSGKQAYQQVLEMIERARDHHSQDQESNAEAIAKCARLHEELAIIDGKIRELKQSVKRADTE